MSSQAEHVAKAEHNESFLDEIGNPFFDWVVTGSFYTALHYVDAYFAKSNVHPINHSDRNPKVATDPVLTAIWSQYRALYDDSIDARYEAHIPIGPGDAQIASRNLAAVKGFIEPLL